MRRNVFLALVTTSILFNAPAALAFGPADLVCFAANASPGFWATVAAVEAAKASGAINSQQECEDAGDIIGDLGVPTGVAKICVCRRISWPAPPPPKPICPQAHTVCAVGSPLRSDMPMNCENGIEGNIAINVCAVDPFCCTNFWDQLCVSQVPTVYWNRIDQAKASHSGFFGAAQRQVIELQAGLFAAIVQCVGPRP